MKAPEIFALVMRICGLVSVLYWLASGLLLLGAGVPWFLVVKSLIWLVVSLWLLRGAPHIVRFAYPEDEE